MELLILAESALIKIPQLTANMLMMQNIFSLAQIRQYRVQVHDLPMHHYVNFNNKNSACICEFGLDMCCGHYRNHLPSSELPHYLMPTISPSLFHAYPPLSLTVSYQRRLEQVAKPSYKSTFGMQSSNGRGCGASEQMDVVAKKAVVLACQ